MTTQPPPPRLRLDGITKRYPGVVANDGVSLTVQPGEIHAVLGENGAGKSTLMKVIYGTVKPDAGQVLFNGRPVQVRNPQEARALGISMVFQHFSLFETLTVAENVWLGLERSQTLAEVTASIAAKGRDYTHKFPTIKVSHGWRSSPRPASGRYFTPEALSATMPSSVTSWTR